MPLIWNLLPVGLTLTTTLVRGQSFSGFSTTALLPFVESITVSSIFSNNVHVDMRISSTTSKLFRPFVDTGSCGIVISAADMDDWSPSEGTAANSGWQYLSSSNWLYNGFWVMRDLYFSEQGLDGTTTGAFVKATVPILAVTKKMNCPSYNSSSPGQNCPQEPIETISDPTGIRIMGIGFGRKADGQPQGTPDKNPLLHITAVHGTDLNTLPPYWPGYIIRKEGITLGLTETETVLMAFTALVPNEVPTARWDLQYDWPELPACIKIDGSVCIPGKALLDTGVGNGFVRVPPGIVTFARDPDTFALDDGVNLEINFGSPAVAELDFVVGERSNIEPDSVHAVYSVGGRSNTFVNTARRIYNKYAVAFDPVFGRVGFKLIGV
jgi:hypothetical protein